MLPRESFGRWWPVSDVEFKRTLVREFIGQLVVSPGKGPIAERVELAEAA